MERLDRCLRFILERLAVTLLTTLVVICFVEVVLRYGFGGSLGWYDEFGGYLLVWLTFVGTALAQQDERHIGLGFFEGRRAAKLVSHALLMGVQLVLLASGFEIAVRFWRESAITLPVPMGFLYAVIPLSAVSVLLIQAVQVRRLFKNA